MEKIITKQNRTIIWITATILSFLSNTVLAQGNTDQIDSLLTYLSDQGMFSGQVLLAEHNKIQFSKAYGTTPGWSDINITTSTPLDIASVSKTFTAAAIMILNERGQLSYDDKLTAYYPQLSYDEVTIRSMLNHTSGLPNIMGLIFEKLDHTRYYTNEDIVELLGKYNPKPSSNAGTRFQYNNLGYELLAGIIEKASGDTYEEFLSTNIFGSLAMTNTSHYSKNSELQEIQGEVTIDNFHLMTKGADNIYSTAEDLYKWDQALYSEKILRKETINEILQRPIFENGETGKWGMGWNILNPDPDDLTLQHMGEGIYTTTSLTRYLAENKTYIFVHTGSRTYSYEIFMMIKNIWEDKPYEVPQKRIVYDIGMDLLQKYVGDYGQNGFMHLSIDEGQFFMQADGAPSAVKLIPESDSTFYFEDEHMQWQIYRSGDEVVGFGPKGDIKNMMERVN